MLPGYLVEPGGDVQAAATLLRERHGVRTACLKPAAGSFGHGIITGIDPSTSNERARRLPAVHADEAAWLVEAQVDYVRFTVGAQRFPLALAGHEHASHPAGSRTLQLTDTSGRDRSRWTPVC